MHGLKAEAGSSSLRSAGTSSAEYSAPDHEVATLKVQMTEVVSQLFLRLTNLQTFEAESVKITPELTPKAPNRPLDPRAYG